MPRLPQMPRPPQMLLDTMVILPQLSRLLQFVSQSQSRSVTRSQSPPKERLEEPSARLWLTSPPSASRSAPRLPTAQLLLAMTPRLDQLRLWLMLLLPLLLLLLLQLLLDMVVTDWLDMAAGNRNLSTSVSHKYHCIK